MSQAVEFAPAAAVATAATRRRIVAFGASLAFLSFLDRAAISQAAPSIVRELGLSPAQMGMVFSAFGLTYSAFEIPSGWLADRLGARALLTRVVLWWSVFTAATGLAWSFPSLFVARLLFGAGESGCFPGLARLFRTWLDPVERNSAEGIKAAAARWGAAITPALMASLYTFLTWRQVFAVFGALGLIWAVLFHLWFRGRGSMVTSSAAPPISWSKLLRARSVWALGLQWFCHYYGFYFYITWLPLYLLQARGLDLRRGALAAGLPLLAAGFGSLIAGWSLSRLSRTWGVARARRFLGYVSYAGAALLLVAFLRIDDPAAAIAVLSLSCFTAEFSGPVSWTSAMDIGGEHVGAVSGFMNMLGHLGGSVAPAVTGFLLTLTTNGWTTAFYCSAIIYAAGAVCWMFIDPTRQIDLER